MRRLRIRLASPLLAALLVAAVGCGSSAPPPTPHKEGDGGASRPHGEPTSKGKKTPPVLND